LEAALDGRGTGEVAARQGVSPVAVSQVRRRLAEKLLAA
jgi:hypothetical protein